jgi:hypothetical protein
MTLVDLSGGRDLQVANSLISRIRVADQEIYRGPYRTDFEDGRMPFALARSTASIVPVNTELSPVHSGVRSVRYGRDTASHGARVDPSLDWKRGDVVSTWLMFIPPGEEVPNQARLGGICINDADTGTYWTAALDTRNGTTSTASIQIRDGVVASGTWGAQGSERVELNTWFRLEAWVDNESVRARFFSASGTLLAGLARPITGPVPTRLQFGLYSYGHTIFDDYQVIPA